MTRKKKIVKETVQDARNGIEIVMLSTGSRLRCPEPSCSGECRKHVKCLTVAWAAVEKNIDRLTMPIVSEFVRLLRREEQVMLRKIRGSLMDDLVRRVGKP